MKSLKAPLVLGIILVGGVCAFLALSRSDDPEPAPTKNRGAKPAHKEGASPALPAPPVRHRADAKEHSGKQENRKRNKQTIALGAELLDARPPDLEAPGKRAWRLRELLGPDYERPEVRVTVQAEDGRLVDLPRNRSEEGPAVLIRREDGSQYIAWLQSNWDEHAGRLADAERPGQRIESVYSVFIEEPLSPEPLVEGSVALKVNQRTVRELTASWITQNSDTPVQNKRRGTSPGIDLLRLGRKEANAEAVNISVVTGESGTFSLENGAPGATPVLYVSRRQQLKFAWIDDAGNALPQTKLRAPDAISIRRP